MTTPTNAVVAPVVRRSALESAHAALGAAWVDETVRWPTGYGSPAAEAAAAALGAGLAEIGPLEELLLRGPGARAAVASMVGPDATVGRLLIADLRGEHGEVWTLGPDEILLVAPVGGTALGVLAEELASGEVSTIEMTGARTTVRLAGPAAPAILAELCAVDLTPDTVADGDAVQASIAGVRAFIARRDAAAGPGYTMMIARDEAAYAWAAFVEIGTAHGLVPVGPAAVRPVSPVAREADR